MSLGRTAIAGVAMGIVMGLANFVMHGFILASAYTSRPEVFSQEEGNPAFFFLTSIVIALFAAAVFAKSRSAWAPGIGGGVVFGVLVGLIVGFTSFYWPMVFAGFPYYLSWCWMGVDVIAYGIGGAVLGLMIKAG